MERSEDQPVLRNAGLLLVGGFLLHNVDHGRRGLDVITEHVIWGGTIVAIIAAVTLTLVFTRHELAPYAAAAAGLGIAVGVSATHLLPAWGALSDSLPDGDVDALTWVAVLAEVSSALVLAAAGLSELRGQAARPGSPRPAPPSGRSAARPRP